MDHRELLAALGVRAKEHVPLLRADPHRWGTGLIHQIDPERDQTLCGKSPAICPGTKFTGPADRITCKSCLRSLEARANAAQREAEFAKRQKEWEERNRLWWAAYNAYLSSPVWQTKRAKVLRRANGRCEGCGDRRAAQVHHLRYPQECLPGSAQWIAQEKLFDLKAICEVCHDDVHAFIDRTPRG